MLVDDYMGLYYPIHIGDCHRLGNPFSTSPIFRLGMDMMGIAVGLTVVSVHLAGNAQNC